MRAGPSGNGPKGRPERSVFFVPAAGAPGGRDHAGGLQKPALPEGHCSGGPVSRAPEGREGHAQKNKRVKLAFLTDRKNTFCRKYTCGNAFDDEGYGFLC